MSINDHKMINEKLQKNMRIHTRLHENWSQVAFILRFVYANRLSMLKYSGIPLLTKILGYAKSTKEDIIGDISCDLINVDSFIDSRYFKNSLLSQQKAKPKTTTLFDFKMNENNENIQNLDFENKESVEIKKVMIESLQIIQPMTSQFLVMQQKSKNVSTKSSLKTQTSALSSKV